MGLVARSSACSQVIQYKGTLLWPLTDIILIRNKDKGQRKKIEHTPKTQRALVTRINWMDLGPWVTKPGAQRLQVTGNNYSQECN